MAVQIFLVLGGYLAAAIWSEGVARFDSVGQQVGKRFVRLVVPYVVALLVTVLVSALVRPGSIASVPGDPDVAQLITHAAAAQRGGDHESLSAGVWYVAIDFQLFTLSVLAFAAVRALPWGCPANAPHGRWPVGGGGGGGSLALGLQPDAQWDGRCIFWRLRPGHDGLLGQPRAAAGGLWPWPCWGSLGAGLPGAHCAGDCNGLAVGVGHAHPCGTPVAGVAPLVRLGQMSYSVFLIHFAVCLLVNAVVSSLWPTSPGANALGMVAAFVLSLVAGQWLYRRVEQHAVAAHIVALAGQPGGGRVLVQLGSNWA